MHIQELEQNMDWIWEVEDERCYHDGHCRENKGRGHDELHHHRECYHNEGSHPQSDYRHWELERKG